MAEVTIEEMARRRDHWRGVADIATRQLMDANGEAAASVSHAAQLLGRISGLEAQVKVLTAQLRASQAETRRHASELGLLRTMVDGDGTDSQ